MEILPRFAVKEGVVAIGEIGYDEQTPLEDSYLRAQIELAKELRAAGHDPHAAPRQEARHAADDGRAAPSTGFDPARCVIDHNNEETVPRCWTRGCWAGVLDLSRAPRWAMSA